MKENDVSIFVLTSPKSEFAHLRMESGISFLVNSPIPQQRIWLCFSPTYLQHLLLSCYKEWQLEKILAQDMTQRFESYASFPHPPWGSSVDDVQILEQALHYLSDSRPFALFPLVLFSCSGEWCGRVSGVHFLWVDLSLSEVAWIQRFISSGQLSVEETAAGQESEDQSPASGSHISQLLTLSVQISGPPQSVVS